MADLVEISINHQVKLRQLSLEDTAILFESIHENHSYLRQFLSWVDGIIQPEQVKKLIQNYLDQTQDEKGISFGIWHKDTLVGACQLYDWNPLLKKVALGYWVAQSVSKKGIATQCAQTMIHYAFEFLQAEKVEIYFLPSNQGSYRIAEKCGFKLEGLLRNWYLLHGQLKDQYIAGLLKSEWLRQQ